MGLYSGLSTRSQQNSISFSRAEAFTVITLSTVTAEGYFSDDEIQVTISSLSRMKLFRGCYGKVL